MYEGGRERERKEGDRIRTSSELNLPRGFNVEPVQVVSPVPYSAGLRARKRFNFCRAPYYPLLPSSKEPGRVVDSFSLTAAGESRICTRTHFTF